MFRDPFIRTAERLQAQHVFHLHFNLRNELSRALGLHLLISLRNFK
jgi:hypothetical protein